MREIKKPKLRFKKIVSILLVMCLVTIMPVRFSTQKVFAAGEQASENIQKAYITSYDSGTVDVLNVETNKIIAGKIRVGENPNSAAVSPDQTKVLITNRGSGTVSIIDTATDSVIKNIKVGEWPHGVCFDKFATKAYVANMSSGTVSVIDMKTLTKTADITVGTNPVCLVSLGGNIYVSHHNRGNISVIDTLKGEVVNTIDVGGSTYGICLTPDGSQLLVGQASGVNELKIINTKTNSVERTIPMGTGDFSSIEVTPNGKYAYVTEYSNNKIDVVDLETYKIVKQISVGSYPYVIGINREGTMAYSVNYSNSSISVIDIATNTVKQTITTSQGPFMVGTFMASVYVSAGDGQIKDKIKDNDNDGTDDADDPDDDNDGISDEEDNHPNDHDNDGTDDADDPDDDNDGISDEEDNHPKDHDNDGTDDVDDPDDDNDGIKDTEDEHLKDHDNDGTDDADDLDDDNDGINDNEDEHPNDHDNDGTDDADDSDDDNDGIPDEEDNHPNDHDNDGINDNEDEHPNDHDNDGIDDADDPDDDNDGIEDTEDEHPKDHDNDGTDDADDPDDDNDGIKDTEDKYTTAITEAATNIGTTEAILNAIVNANSVSTTVNFEFGQTTSYGTTVTTEQSPVTGTTNTAVSKEINGLIPNTTYHYRVVCINSGGTTYGSDITFTTSEFATVILEEGSFGTVGDSKVTGLNSRRKYKVIVGGETKYVKADGTLSDNEADVAPLTGTEITGLTNGTAYNVELYLEIPDTSHATYLTSKDNLNEDGEEISDDDLGERIINYEGDAQDIEFNINVVGPLPEISAELLIRAYDVDEESGEDDKVYFNDKFIGFLSGADDEWSTTRFSIPVDTVTAGNNKVTIEVDEGFSLTVDWGQLVLDGGSEQYGKIQSATGTLHEGQLTTNFEVLGTDSNREFSLELNLINELGYILAIREGTYTTENENEILEINDLEFVDVPEGQYTLQVFLFDYESKMTQSLKLVLISGTEITKWNQVAHQAVENTDYTKNDTTYGISTPLGLAWAAKQINSGELKEVVIELENDIDLSAYEWTPIGGLNQFNGEFNGNSHTISGLKIGQADVANGTLPFVGFFGVINEDGQVHDVTIETDGIYSNYSELVDDLFAGVLAGRNEGTIVNCMTLGCIECGSSTEGKLYCGGIAGKNYGYIKKSHSESKVICGNGDGNSIYIGGLVGKNYEIIDHSYATGAVQAGDADANIYIGGFVGKNGGLITNAYATGNTIVGDLLEEWNLQIGGFAGNNESYIGNSYATGNVTGGRFATAGGFVGFLEYGVIENCYAVGETCGSYEEYTNGFVGEEYGTIDYAYYNSDAKQTVDGNIVSPANDNSKNVTSKTSDEMKLDDFKTLLNTNRQSCTPPEEVTFGEWKRTDDRNNGYPELLGVETAPVAPKVPSVTTATASNVEENTATIGGTVTNDGGASVTEKGILYSIAVKTPTIEADRVIKVAIGSETGSFSKKVLGLSAETTYYIRAYAVNSAGTAYGEVKTFTTKELEKLVILAEGSLGTAGDGKVTGLHSGEKYKVIVDNETKYVKADGTLSDNEADVTSLTGTEITGLTNGITYKVVQLGGNGSEENPFEISTAEQLVMMADNVNNHNTEQIADSLTYGTAHYKLTKDIVLNDTTDWESWGSKAPANEWTPIGNASNKFKGTFDGNDHFISGIYINSTENNQGLFGYVDGGTIKNVSVKKSYIKGNMCVGGVVGYVINGEISNCCNTGYIEGNYDIGGVVGSVRLKVKIVNCCNTGDITKGYGSGSVGGIVGYIRTGTVSNCFNEGSVSSSQNYAGGIVGYMDYGEVTNCYNTGNISGKSDVGGIMGHCMCTINQCYNVGAVDGSNYVGGVVGNLLYGEITNCYYDKQMCTVGGIDGIDEGGKAEGKLTSDMIGNKLEGTLGDIEAWTFTAEMYPRLNGIDYTIAAIVSTTPIFLAGDETVDRVVTNFTVGTKNNVTWESSNQDIIKISGANAIIKQKSSELKTTLTASWGDSRRVIVLTLATYNIAGTVSINENNLVNGATVVLKQGNREIGSTTTSTNGKYSFTDLKNGVYNLVVTKDEKTVTSIIVIQNADVSQNVYLPNENKDSILEVAGEETPEVVVGGLDEVAEQSSESEVVIKMTVEKKEENTAQNAADIKKAANGKKLDFMDMKVLKITNGTSQMQSELVKVLEIVIPYNFTEKSDINVYRYHGNTVDIFKKLESKPVENYKDGTCYLDETNEFIYVYAQKFSTYAIGYKTAEQKIITFDANGGTVSSATIFTGTNGKIEKLPTPTYSGSYTFDGWYTELNGGTKITNDTVFTENVTVYAHWTYRSSSSVDYNISISVDGKGTITPNGGSDNIIKVYKQKNQTFTIKAKEGYLISDVLVDGTSVGAVDKYTFENVKKDHTIKVVFLAQSSTKRQNPFTDVKEQDWFYDEVLKAYEKGIMAGTSDKTFSPDLGTSRAMIATIIHRLENRPDYRESNPFNDVLKDEWYTDGVAWCAEHKIVKGYGEGIFKPNQIVTREELCAILYRYAEYKGLDVKQNAQLSSFIDETQIADWAKKSVSFAVKSELLQGNDYNQLQPKNQATRAEVATVILNLLQLIEF